MSSLWTPGGEHEVPRDQRSEEEPAGNDVARRPGAEHEPGTTIGPEQAAELDQLEAEIASAPVGDVIANHCYGLFQLAAVHLGQQPPHLEQARAAIDALGAIVETLGDRLGQSAPTLVEGLSQIRLAFVQIAGAGAAGTDTNGTGAPSQDGPPAS